MTRTFAGSCNNARHALLRASARLSPPATLARFAAERWQRFYRLAAHVHAALDLPQIKGWL